MVTIGWVRSAGAGAAVEEPGLDFGRVVAQSWMTATAAIGVLTLAHAGLHEHRDLPPLLHAIRDASLAVPLAAIGVAGAALVVRSPRGASGLADSPSIRRRLSYALLAALLFALLSIPGSQLHGLLFGAEAEPGSWLLDALADGAATFGVALATLVTMTFTAGPPWRVVRSAPQATNLPGPTLPASAGHHSIPATAGSTHAGGDR